MTRVIIIFKRDKAQNRPKAEEGRSETRGKATLKSKTFGPKTIGKKNFGQKTFGHFFRNFGQKNFRTNATLKSKQDTKKMLKLIVIPS